MCKRVCMCTYNNKRHELHGFNSTGASKDTINYGREAPVDCVINRAQSTNYSSVIQA